MLIKNLYVSMGMAHEGYLRRRQMMVAFFSKPEAIYN